MVPAQPPVPEPDPRGQMPSVAAEHLRSGRLRPPAAAHLARRALAIFVGLLLALAGCRGAPESVSPTAQPEIAEEFRRDLAAPRHPADGGGRGWIEEPPAGAPPVRAGESARWTLVYEAGELGIAEGGVVYLQVSPFWGWSTPQVVDPEGPGFTEVSTEAAGVELEAATLDRQLLGIRVGGRPLEPGERIRLLFGAGPAGARADRFAERGTRFWFAVDGDGDGIRALVADSPTLEIAPGDPELLVVHLPGTARPGEPVRLTLAVLDGYGNAGVEFAGEIRLEGGGAGLELPESVILSPEDRGRKSVEGLAREPGRYRVTATGPTPLAAESNPLEVSAEGPRVLWADLHGHSNLTDGTGTPADYFTYARDVAALDAVALTDHDHWGLQALAVHPELWEEIRRETELRHEPGRFVTLLGYEWTSWVHGHRHVLYFEDRGEIFSSVDRAYETPADLWRALRGRPALTFAHHSAGGPVATNWDYPPDPELEPVTEIASVHGSSEALDSPFPIYRPISGNFVRDVLARGYRLGLIGSGDSHDGHPGLAGVASPSSGLAAILSEELTREGIQEALKARRVYATNGPRILLRATLDGRPMGSVLARDPSRADPLPLAAEVAGTSPLVRVELIGAAGILDYRECDDRLDCRADFEVPASAPGGFLYLRALQRDGGAAWSSPFFLE